MSKSSDYYISGVWKDSQKRVIHVMLHEVIDDSHFRNGVKKTKEYVVDLISKGNIIKTLVWEYPNWMVGAKVISETVNNVKYLKTVPDASVRNNLDNLIPMDSFS